ncbi:patched domain-containing protein 3-like [Centruroides vittatus]|uniref:patched domain-containing protein 3-like n=1 Tax=Centruroides vittatus TaxID=120091 RepID=UPI0035109AE5
MMIGIAYHYLSQAFQKHGINISRNTSWYITVPIFVTLILATGLQNFHHDLDEDSIVPTGGIIDKYKSRLMQLFPTNFKRNFDPARVLRNIHYGTVIVQAFDGGSVLREFIFREIVSLDREIQNFVINEEGWKYKDICAKNEGKCYVNKILLLENKLKEFKSGTFRLKYPNGNISRNYDVLTLGGVELNEEGYVLSAKSVKLFYFLYDSNKLAEEIAIKWENRFVDTVNKLNFSYIKINKDVSHSRDESKKQLFLATLKYIPSSLVLMMTFTIVSCLTPDFLRSKPWTGIMSSVSTGMSIISGFGLLQYAGIGVSPMETMVPFLILGIGMDDTFVILKAWMKTDPTKSVQERMAETFSESGVSITITSLTNIASFSAGIFIATIPMYEKFCMFMAIPFSFISENETLLQRIFCFVRPEDSKNEKDNKTVITLTKFVDIFNTLMKKRLTAVIVLLVYFIYLGISIWGLTKFSYEQELDMNLVHGTYRYYYHKTNEKYYNQYKYRLQLYITEELDYSNPTTQRNVQDMLQTLESDPLIAGSLTESWFRSYLQFISDNRINSFINGYNLTNSEDFIFVLRKLFLRIPEAKRFRHDISFNGNLTKIVSSRFFFQTNITKNGSDFYNQFNNFREKLNSFPFSTVVYHPLFYHFDILDAIPTTTIQTLCIVLFTVFIISCTMLPNVICIVCVLFSIISVGAGVMGFMFLLIVGLNITSVSVLIVVIGYSVDYAAHVSCAYISAAENCPDKRLENAISMTATPIVQGSMTTILAIIAALNVSEKETLLSIKIIILACIIASIHGIAFVPIIISLIDRIFQKYHYLRSKWESSKTSAKETERNMNTSAQQSTGINIIYVTDSTL